jgi:hypothetical protein
MKFSLFLLERTFLGVEQFTEECCILLKTYNTLEEAQSAQKEFKHKTIILPSY